MTDFLTFRDQEYYANLQEQLDAMNDADLTERAYAVMREFDERCAAEVIIHLDDAAAGEDGVSFRSRLVIAAVRV